MPGKEARFAAALQWLRDANDEAAIDADRRHALLEGARAVVGAEILFVGAAAGAPRSRGRGLRIKLGGDIIVAAYRLAPFSEWERQFLQQVGEALLKADTTLRERLEAVERKALTTTLQRTRGNKARAARLLGITRGGLYLKMRRHRIS